MKLHEYTEHIKKEYQVANEMFDHTRNQYWFGRYTALGEILDMVGKERTKPYKNCKLCTFEDRSCEKCFK